MIQELHALGKAVRAQQSSSPYKELVPSYAETTKDHRPKKEAERRSVKYRWQAVHFNLDAAEIELPNTKPLPREDEAFWNVGFVIMDARRGLKHFPAVRFPKHYKQFTDSFIGKGDQDGDLLRWAEKNERPGADADLSFAVREIGSLLSNYAFTTEDGEQEISLEDKLKGRSDKQEPICAIYATVTCADRGWHEKPVAEIGNFRALHTPAVAEAGGEQLCYFTNTRTIGVDIPNSTVRYNLNKVFVTETVNYASGFERKNYQDAFRLSPEATLNLEEGSNYLLNAGTLKVDVAGSPHVIIPAAITTAEDSGLSGDFIASITDLQLTIFSLQERNVLVERLEDYAVDAAFTALTYVAYSSDGNSTKITNTIREVDRYQFDRIVSELAKCNIFYAPELGKYGANLYSIFAQAPAPKDSDKKPSLALFTALLEGRSVSAQYVYQLAMESLLVHHFGRYPKYDYPRELRLSGDQQSSALYFGHRNVITQFLILRRLLLALGQYQHPGGNSHNSIAQMENENSILAENQTADYQEQIQAFFDFNAYTPRMQACFYLGRAISRVAWEQEQRGNAKTIIQRIDYSGMDARKLIGLVTAIEEKGSLYRLDETNKDGVRKFLLDKIAYDLARFRQGFDANNWSKPRQTDGGLEPPLLPQETTFYVMSGYVFRAHRSD